MKLKKQESRFKSKACSFCHYPRHCYVAGKPLSATG
jgi:hypothetical protein